VARSLGGTGAMIDDRGQRATCHVIVLRSVARLIAIPIAPSVAPQHGRTRPRATRQTREVREAAVRRREPTCVSAWRCRHITRDILSPKQPRLPRSSHSEPKRERAPFRVGAAAPDGPPITRSRLDPVPCADAGENATVSDQSHVDRRKRTNTCTGPTRLRLPRRGARNSTVIPPSAIRTRAIRSVVSTRRDSLSAVTV